MKQGKARTQKELMSWCRISTVGFQVAAHCKRRCDVLGMMVAPQFQLPTKIRPHSHYGVLTVCYSHMPCALGNKTLKGQPTTLGMEVSNLCIKLFFVAFLCQRMDGCRWNISKLGIDCSFLISFCPRMDGCMQLECIKPLHKLFFSLISFVPGWMDGCPCDTCIKPWHKLFFSLISFVPGWMDGWMLM